MATWFEEKVSSSGLKDTSNAALVRAMKGSERWPDDETRNDRTIANRLADLRRGDATEWWRDSAAALLGALEDVLGCEQGEIVAILDAGNDAGSRAQTIWRFEVFSALRPVDLRAEDLIPGIPKALLSAAPPSHVRLWWKAPPGGGKSLVGSWLRARHAWQTQCVDTWSDLKPPTTGRLYIELGPNCRPTRRQLYDLPVGPTIWIASEHPLPRWDVEDERPWHGVAIVDDHDNPGGEEHQGRAFVSVQSESAEKWWRLLVQWVGNRIEPGGGFELKEATEQVGLFVERGLLESPGEVISFLGMLDDTGLDDSADDADALLRWVRVWLRYAIDRSDRDGVPGVSALLKRDGADLLAEAERTRLAQGLPPVLPREQWVQLLPSIDDQPPNSTELLRLLDEEGPAAVRAALRPGADDIVEALVRCRALGECDGGLVLRPAWLARVVGNVALERTWAKGTDGIGALALHEDTASATLERLFDELSRGEMATTVRLVGADGDSPESAASVELAFRAIGWALLEGLELPLPLVRAAWDTHVGSHRRPDGTVPEHPLRMVRVTTDEVVDAGWTLSALATSHFLREREVPLAPSWTAPWDGLDPGGQQRSILARAVNSLTTDRSAIGAPPELLASAWKLGEPLVDAVGVLRGSFGAVVPLQSPAIVARILSGDTGLQLSDPAMIGPLRTGYGALVDACTRLDVPLDAALACYWRHVWSNCNSSDPPFDGLGWHDPGRGYRLSTRFTSENPATELLQTLWGALPGDALTVALCNKIEQHAETVGRWISSEVWRAWFTHLDSKANRPASTRALEHAPLEVVLDVLREGRIQRWMHEEAPVLWARDPQRLLELVDEFEAKPPPPCEGIFRTGGPLSMLVLGSPPAVHAALVTRAQRWLEEHRSAQWMGAWLTAWLRRLVVGRSPAWREAYDLLPIAPAIMDQA